MGGEMELRFDESDDSSLIATGRAGRLDWYLRQFALRGTEQIVFAAAHRGDHDASDGCAGILLLDGEEPLFGVEAAAEARFVWGVAPHGCASVVVTDENGRAHEVAPDAGRLVDIRPPFVLVLPSDAIPRVVSFIDAHGDVLVEVAAPERRQAAEDRPVEVETTASPSGEVERVAATGLLGETRWTYELRRSGRQIDDQFTFRGSLGGAGGGGGSGGIPAPTAARRLAVSGSGGGGGTWHVNGWADPAVGEVDLVLADGQVLRTRPFGEELGVGVSYFAFCLRDTDRPRLLEGFDSTSHLVDRCWLRSKVATTEAWLDDALAKKRRAAEPVPAAIAEMWRRITGREIAPVGEVTTLQGEEAVAPAARWPFTPAFAAPPELAASHGPLDSRVVARQHTSAYQRIVVFSLETSIGRRALSGPDTAEGGVILTQTVWWSDPRGHRDEPNTTVRGRPGHFASYTAEVNNFESLELSWIEPAPSLPAPFQGITVSLRAHPGHHSQETLFAIAESLVPV